MTYITSEDLADLDDTIESTLFRRHLDKPHVARAAAFIELCLPSSADNPPFGSNWIHEIKARRLRVDGPA